MTDPEYDTEEGWDDYGDPSKQHEICDQCGNQMWWDAAGTDWRCDVCETQYE